MSKLLPYVASIGLHGVVIAGIVSMERQAEVSYEVVPIEVELVEYAERADAEGESEMVDESKQEVLADQVEGLLEQNQLVECEESELTVGQKTENEEIENEEEECQREVEEPEESADIMEPPAERQEEEHSQVVAPAQALNRIEPVYPRSARRRGREGSVTVEASIDENGMVASTRVVESSGSRDLDEAALVAVREAKFAPATWSGAGVSSTLRLTFDFKLKAK